MEAMRFFNTEGPVRAGEHYCIPPLERVDLDDVVALVRTRKYFVLHAPRQTGRTSALLALRDLLNSGAAGSVAQDDVEAETAWYVDAGGGLGVDKLLEAFQRFFREHSEHWSQRFDRYQEAGPQLLLQAYLQKVVNGGGRVPPAIP